MKYLFAGILTLAVSPAFAQMQPTAEQISAACHKEMGGMLVQLGNTEDKMNQLISQNANLTKQLADLQKTAKKDTPKKPVASSPPSP